MQISMLVEVELALSKYFMQKSWINGWLVQVERKQALSLFMNETTELETLSGELIRAQLPC